MTPEDLAVIAKTVERAVQPAIEKHVNGYMREFKDEAIETRAMIVSHMESSREYQDKASIFMDEMRPVRDGLITFQNLNKATKWIGLPAIGALIYAFFFNK